MRISYCYSLFFGSPNSMTLVSPSKDSAQGKRNKIVYEGFNFLIHIQEMIIPI